MCFNIHDDKESYEKACIEYEKWREDNPGMNTTAIPIYTGNTE